MIKTVFYILFLFVYFFYPSKTYSQWSCPPSSGWVGWTNSCSGGPGYCLGTNGGSANAFTGCTMGAGLTCYATGSTSRCWTCSDSSCSSGSAVPGVGSGATCSTGALCGKSTCGGTYRSCGPSGNSSDAGCYSGQDAYGCGAGAYYGTAQSCTDCSGIGATVMNCCSDSPPPTNTPTPTTSGGGGGPTNTPVPPPTNTPVPPTNTPTNTPVGCSCGAWTNGACGGGGCPANQRLQTRTCSPNGCSSQSQCVADAACGPTNTPTRTPTPTNTPVPSCGTCLGSCPCGTSCSGTCSVSGNTCPLTGPVCPTNTPTNTPTRTPTPTNTPTPTPPCTCSGWTSGACGTSGCASNQRPMTRSCSFPSACQPEFTCAADPACAPTPTLPPSCNCSAFVNGACGINGCAAGERYQSRTCNPGACAAETNCAPDGSCALPTPPPPPPTQCSIARPRDPSDPSCTTGGPGNITWNWDVVPNATEYIIEIYRSGGPLQTTSNWLPAASFGAGCTVAGGTCSYTTSHVPGTYYSQIRARGTCTESLVSVPHYETISLCPTPTMQIYARAVTAPGNNLACADIQSSVEYLDNAGIPGFSAEFLVNPGLLTAAQDPGTHWASLAPITSSSTYQIDPAIAGPGSASYQLGNACLYNNSGTLISQGFNALNNIAEAPGETRRFYAGYRQPVAWTQVGCGDVYAYGGLQSQVPAGASAAQFLQNCSGSNTPSVVTYGNTTSGFDFSFDNTNDGRSIISPPLNCIANEQFPPRNHCSQLFTLLGAPTTPTSTTDTLGAVPAVAASGVNYYRPTSGTLTITNAWNIPAGVQLVIYVEGNLEINDTIRLANPTTSFVAFIVTGNVTVAGTVGTVSYAISPPPHLEAILVSCGAFTVEASNEQCAISGAVIANTVSFQRDLGYENNALYPGVVVTHNPNLLFSMPQILQNIPVLWQEVAP